MSGCALPSVQRDAPPHYRPGVAILAGRDTVHEKRRRSCVSESRRCFGHSQRHRTRGVRAKHHGRARPQSFVRFGRA